jgi:molybdate transport system substrate-binding protein
MKGKLPLTARSGTPGASGAIRLIGSLLALLAGSFPVVVSAADETVTIVSPGFLYNGGLDILARGFEEETGTRIIVRHTGMGEAMDAARNGEADAVFLPADLMDELAVEGVILPATRARVGRAYQGLAVRKGSAIPDISTPENFVAALESANLVLYSRCRPDVIPGQEGCTRTAKMMADLLARPEFAKVKSAPSAYGEGGAALARNEGDMAIQNISQILLWDNLQVAGPIPEPFGMYMDGVAAIPANAPNAPGGRRFIQYATQPGTFSIWWSRGVDPREGAP